MSRDLMFPNGIMADRKTCGETSSPIPAFTVHEYKQNETKNPHQSSKSECECECESKRDVIFVNFRHRDIDTVFSLLAHYA